MIGWHTTFDEKSELMQICVKLNKLTSEYNTRLGMGQYSDANKDPESFEFFYLRMCKVMKVIDRLSNSLLSINCVIFGHMKKIEGDFKKEADTLAEKEKTEFHILNQLLVLRKLAHKAQTEPDEDKFTRIYEGVVRLESFFKKNVEEISKIKKTLKKQLEEVEELVK